MWGCCATHCSGTKSAAKAAEQGKRGLTPGRMADRRQRRQPLAVISRAVTGFWVVVPKAGIEWEETGIQVSLFGCGLKQINCDSTFCWFLELPPLPPISHPSGG